MSVTSSGVGRGAAARSWAGLLAMVLAGALAVAGCGAGPSAQTSQESPAVNGSASTGGPVVVRDAMILVSAAEQATGAPAGATVPLGMWIVNQGQQADTLVAASSPVSASVDLGGDLAVQPGWAIAVGPPAGTTTAPSAGPGGEPVRHAQLALVGLRQAITPGVDYPLTLTFEHAGPVTLTVPVGSPTAD